jgi:hypothetical protein
LVVLKRDVQGLWNRHGLDLSRFPSGARVSSLGFIGS